MPASVAPAVRPLRAPRPSIARARDRRARHLGSPGSCRRPKQVGSSRRTRSRYRARWPRADLRRESLPNRFSCPGPRRRSRSRETRRVRVRVACGAPGRSGVTRRQSKRACLCQTDWSARFISPGHRWCALARPRPCSEGRSTSPSEAVRARLYVTAHGVHAVTLNGTRASDEVLAPGWTSYHHRLRYQTYDVTDLVRTGHERRRRCCWAMAGIEDDSAGAGVARSTATAWRSSPSSRSPLPMGRCTCSTPTRPGPRSRAGSSPMTSTTVRPLICASGLRLGLRRSRRRSTPTSRTPRGARWPPVRVTEERAAERVVGPPHRERRSSTSGRTWSAGCG